VAHVAERDYLRAVDADGFDHGDLGWSSFAHALIAELASAQSSCNQFVGSFRDLEQHSNILLIRFVKLGELTAVKKLFIVLIALAWAGTIFLLAQSRLDRPQLAPILTSFRNGPGTKFSCYLMQQDTRYGGVENGNIMPMRDAVTIWCSKGRYRVERISGDLVNGNPAFTEITVWDGKSGLRVRTLENKHSVSSRIHSLQDVVPIVVFPEDSGKWREQTADGDYYYSFYSASAKVPSESYSCEWTFDKPGGTLLAFNYLVQHGILGRQDRYEVWKVAPFVPTKDLFELSLPLGSKKR
jgi:hypothetical protein